MFSYILFNIKAPTGNNVENKKIRDPECSIYLLTLKRGVICACSGVYVVLVEAPSAVVLLPSLPHAYITSASPYFLYFRLQ